MVTAPRSRNALCPCGSGLRYKHCHGAIAKDALVENNNPLEGLNALLAEGKFKEAIEACEKHISANGEDLATLRFLGNALAMNGDPERTRDTWLVVLKSVPDDPEALFHLGSQAHISGDSKAAIDFFEKALMQAPSHVTLLNNLGVALEAAGRLADAEKRFRQAYDITPGLFETMANLTQNLFQQDRFREALPWFEQLETKFDITDAAILANRAICQYYLNDPDAALKSFERAFEFEKEPEALYLEFAIVNRKLNQYDVAAKAVERCLQINPENVTANAERFILRQNMANWKDFEINRARFLDIAASIEALMEEPIEPFFFLMICDDPGLQHNVTRAWVRKKTLERLEHQPE